ncbi:MAG: N-acetylmuramoyl-L-alanine amidase [Clostridia bacterium]|nr:N-acetylmuramoyl-L-alanine amidase [Clostridia bacterium]
MYKKLMLICLAFSLLCCVILSTKNIHAKKVLLKSGFTVVVDAGHGGVDSGVTGTTTGVKEADLNLTVAGLIGKSFYAQGDTVVLTRQNSLGLYGVMSKGFKQRDLEKRVL